MQFITIQIRSAYPALADRLRKKTTFTSNGKDYQAYDDDDVSIVSKTIQEEATMVISLESFQLSLSTWDIVGSSWTVLETIDTSSSSYA